jgi:lipoprotein-anchoring transpeptidase ErfK/SrfK
LKRGLFVVVAVLCLAVGGPAAASAATVQPGDPLATAALHAVASASPARAIAATKATKVTLPASVRIAGVRVGRLSPDHAEKVVDRAFRKRLTVVVDRLRLRVDPRGLATPYVAGAVGKARAAKPGTSVPLFVSVHGAAVRAWAKRLAQRIDRRPADDALKLRDGKPFIAPRALGRHLDERELVQKVVRALAGNTRLPVRVATEKLQPPALADGSPAVIVIDRGRNQLSLFKGTRPWRTFRVATGQSAYPTPRGTFHIVVMWQNPWWYPPASPWAAGEEPVPPGPSNPLGTRWMGLSAPGVGIHGTPNPGSIGYSLSHGCIRMLIPQAEWLFEHVDVGTTVFIV